MRTCAGASTARSLLRPFVIFFPKPGPGGASLALPTHARSAAMKSLEEFCAAMSFSAGRWTVIAIAIADDTASEDSDAAQRESQSMKVEVIGEGRPLVKIPGVNSAAENWSEHCQALQPDVQCHILQLPSFAGQAPVKEEHWLE